MGDGALSEARILVVEDEYILADELRSHLNDAGAAVVGPVGTLHGALELIDTAAPIHGAILDAKLRDEMVYPVADRLEKEGIPYFFITGYDMSVIPSRFNHIGRFEKPMNLEKLCYEIGRLLNQRRGGSKDFSEIETR